MQKGIHETTEYLEIFLRNLLLNEKNELHKRDMHISGSLNTAKVEIENTEVDIQNTEVDIESTLLEKNSSIKTANHVRKLFEKFGYDEVFGRSAVMKVIDLRQSGASKFLSNLVQKDIIEQVSGHGKGKYKFKK